MKDRIPETSWSHAAWVLGCEVAAIRAVAQVESHGRAFLATGEPTLLFERHVFHRLTSGRWTSSHPDLSNPTPGGYGLYSGQHKRLRRAVELDRNSALMSASWGQFQVMGFNHRRAGATSLQDFVNRMYESADEHLRAFTLFVLSDVVLAGALRKKNWQDVARLYNGPNHEQSNYSGRMAAAYEGIHGDRLS